MAGNKRSTATLIIALLMEFGVIGVIAAFHAAQEHVNDIVPPLSMEEKSVQDLHRSLATKLLVLLLENGANGDIAALLAEKEQEKENVYMLNQETKEKLVQDLRLNLATITLKMEKVFHFIAQLMARGDPGVNAIIAAQVEKGKDIAPRLNMEDKTVQERVKNLAQIQILAQLMEIMANGEIVASLVEAERVQDNAPLLNMEEENVLELPRRLATMVLAPSMEAGLNGWNVMLCVEMVLKQESATILLQVLEVFLVLETLLKCAK